MKTEIRISTTNGDMKTEIRISTTNGEQIVFKTDAESRTVSIGFGPENNYDSDGPSSVTLTRNQLIEVYNAFRIAIDSVSTTNV